MMPTRLQIEKWGPMLFGTLFTAAWCYLDGRITEYFAKELLAALLSAAAIAAGFLATAISILLPMGSTPTGIWLRKKGFLPGLVNYLARAIYSCLWLAFVCVAAFFLLIKDSDVHQWVAAVIVYSSAYTAAALARIFEVLLNLFERASESENLDG
jgi:hypothetical protein